MIKQVGSRESLLSNPIQRTGNVTHIVASPENDFPLRTSFFSCLERPVSDIIESKTKGNEGCALKTHQLLSKSPVEVWFLCTLYSDSLVISWLPKCPFLFLKFQYFVHQHTTQELLHCLSLYVIIFAVLLILQDTPKIRIYCYKHLVCIDCTL